jgi:hypothetical protein
VIPPGCSRTERFSTRERGRDVDLLLEQLHDRLIASVGRTMAPKPGNAALFVAAVRRFVRRIGGPTGRAAAAGLLTSPGVRASGRRAVTRAARPR